MCFHRNKESSRISAVLSCIAIQKRIDNSLSKMIFIRIRNNIVLKAVIYRYMSRLSMHFNIYFQKQFEGA